MLRTARSSTHSRRRCATGTRDDGLGVAPGRDRAPEPVPRLARRVAPDLPLPPALRAHAATRARPRPAGRDPATTRARVALVRAGGSRRAGDRACDRVQDVARASDLVAIHAREFWSSGRNATVTRWLDALSWPEARGGPAARHRPGRDARPHAATAPTSSSGGSRSAAAGSHDGPLANGMHSLESGIALVRSLFLTKRARDRGSRGANGQWSSNPRTASGGGRRSPRWVRPATCSGEARRRGRRSRRRGACRTRRATRRAPPSSSRTSRSSSSTSAARTRRSGSPCDALALLEERHLTGGVRRRQPRARARRRAHARHRRPRRGRRTSSGRWRCRLRSARPTGTRTRSCASADARHRLGDDTGAREALESARFELNALPDTGMLESLLAEKDEQLHERHRARGLPRGAAVGKRAAGSSPARRGAVAGRGRQGALPLAEHRQDAPPHDLPQARGEHARGRARACRGARDRRSRRGRITRMNRAGRLFGRSRTF